MLLSLYIYPYIYYYITILRPESFAFLSRIHNAASSLSLVQLDIRLPAEHEQWVAAFEGNAKATVCSVESTSLQIWI